MTNTKDAGSWSKLLHAALEIPLLYENVFGKSETKTVYVEYALTITVKDAITKKSVVGATVTVDTTEKATDETGAAIFETLSPGTYTVEVKHSSYLSKSFSVTVTEAGAVREVTLIPLWGVGLGVVGGGIALTVAITKVLKWW